MRYPDDDDRHYLPPTTRETENADVDFLPPWLLRNKSGFRRYVNLFRQSSIDKTNESPLFSKEIQQVTGTNENESSTVRTLFRIHAKIVKDVNGE